jgi:hypothetical protein
VRSDLGVGTSRTASTADALASTRGSALVPYRAYLPSLADGLRRTDYATLTASVIIQEALASMPHASLPRMLLLAYVGTAGGVHLNREERLPLSISRDYSPNSSIKPPSDALGCTRRRPPAALGACRVVRLASGAQD